MRRRLKLQLRAGRALFETARREAAQAFAEGRHQDALAIYERFAEEHPNTQVEQLQLHIHALREYIENPVTKQHDTQKPTPPS